MRVAEHTSNTKNHMVLRVKFYSMVTTLEHLTPRKIMPQTDTRQLDT